MSVTIKVALEITVSDTALEDAMAEYDELSVEGLVREIIDKSIACDQVIARVDEGPNTSRNTTSSPPSPGFASGGARQPNRSS